MQHTLTARELAYSYGQHRAVDSVSFHIDPGEVYGLLGPNGAGKTTLINMVSSLIEPDSGSISFEGQDVHGHPGIIRPGLGVVPQEISLYDELSGRENLEFFGRLYGMQGAELRSRTGEVLDLVGLARDANRRLGSYSGGMKRRINIGAGLMHSPRLILMDEPTVGVDPQSRNYIYELIQLLSDRGSSILYTTHYMEEAQRLCDRIGIVDNGRLIAEGSLDELLELLPQRDLVRISILDAENQELERMATGPLARFGARIADDMLLLNVDNAGRSLHAITGAIGTDAARISDLSVERANLENVFLHLTGRSLRED